MKIRGLLWITANIFHFLPPTSASEARGSQLNWSSQPHTVCHQKYHGPQRHLWSSQVTNAGKAWTQNHQGNMTFLLEGHFRTCGNPPVHNPARKESHCFLLDKFNEVMHESYLPWWTSLVRSMTQMKWTRCSQCCRFLSLHGGWNIPVREPTETWRPGGNDATRSRLLVICRRIHR